MSTVSGTVIDRQLPSSSRRWGTVIWLMAITWVARPTQRIIASYQMPMFRMLNPLMSRSWRQCSVESRSVNPVWDWTSRDTRSPMNPSEIRRISRSSIPKLMGDGTIWATRLGDACDAASISWASAAVMAMRASQSTCLPASSDAMVRVRCM